jgi:cytoskeletal protein CcmA (bactofilin family)
LNGSYATIRIFVPAGLCNATVHGNVLSTRLGDFYFSEPVVIEGRFRGEIRSTDLVVIGEQAFLEGQVRAARLLVLGEMHGAVVGSRQVALGPRARFQGKVEARSLIVSAGAMLNAELKIAGGPATAGADRPKDQTKP